MYREPLAIGQFEIDLPTLFFYAPLNFKFFFLFELFC